MNYFSKIILSFLLFLTFSITTFYAQYNDNQGVVDYSFRYNGKLNEKFSLRMFYNNGIVSYESNGSRKEKKEKQFLNFNTDETIQLLTIDGDNKYILKKNFADYEQGSATNESDKILGYECKKAIFHIKSNTIEVWYTNDLPIKGTPNISVAPGIGLVLKMIRNNDYEIFAKNVEVRKLSDEEKNYNFSNAKEVDPETYLRKLIDSRYEIIPVFEHQKINFGDTINNPAGDELNITYRYSKGTVLLKKIKLPELKIGTTVFAEISQWSNGDAYDRVGSVFIIPDDKDTTFLDAFKNGIEKLPKYFDSRGEIYQGVIATKNFDPALELMRFFTPFGVRKFNDCTKIKGYVWADSVVYRREITDLLPNSGKEIRIGIFIGNYDKGGHIASLNLKIYPSFEQSDSLEKVWIQPIFNTVNIMEMSGQNYGTMFHNDSLKVTVNIPEGLENLKLKYTGTGHGGWGNGDEFNQKKNKIFIDDSLVYSFIPWRDDCGTYRLSNPSSGNFSNGLSSSDLSRSNWCPGTVTVPEDITLDNLIPGKHTFKVAIPIGEREGGSFSSWNVSGTLVGKFKN